jgi:hypothetical protein
MTITIPPEALEAHERETAKRRGYDWLTLSDGTRGLFRDEARAACRAMLSAWPGMRQQTHEDLEGNARPGR